MVRRSLLGRTAQTVARTAVIAGTATAVSGAVAGRQGRGAAEPPAAAPAGLSTDAMAQLQKLAELRDSGILTEQEFAEQKARLLS